MKHRVILALFFVLLLLGTVIAPGEMSADEFAEIQTPTAEDLAKIENPVVDQFDRLSGAEKDKYVEENTGKCPSCANEHLSHKFDCDVNVGNGEDVNVDGSKITNTGSDPSVTIDLNNLKGADITKTPSGWNIKGTSTGSKTNTFAGSISDIKLDNNGNLIVDVEPGKTAVVNGGQIKANGFTKFVIENGNIKAAGFSPQEGAPAFEVAFKDGTTLVAQSGGAVEFNSDLDRLDYLSSGVEVSFSKSDDFSGKIGIQGGSAIFNHDEYGLESFELTGDVNDFEWHYDINYPEEKIVFKDIDFKESFKGGRFADNAHIPKKTNFAIQSDGAHAIIFDNVEDQLVYDYRGLDYKANIDDLGKINLAVDQSTGYYGSRLAEDSVLTYGWKDMYWDGEDWQIENYWKGSDKVHSAYKNKEYIDAMGFALYSDTVPLPPQNIGYQDFTETIDISASQTSAPGSDILLSDRKPGDKMTLNKVAWQKVHNYFKGTDNDDTESNFISDLMSYLFGPTGMRAKTNGGVSFFDKPKRFVEGLHESKNKN